MGTREGIFNMRMVQERYLEVNKDVYICFIDYEKAFDRVDQEKMIECLRNIGVDDRDCRIITTPYWLETAVLRIGVGYSPSIEIKREVRQGCVLSPGLFNRYTEFIFRKIENINGVILGGQQYNNFRYADDTALLGETGKDLQETLNKVNDEGK